MIKLEHKPSSQKRILIVMNKTTETLINDISKLIFTDAVILQNREATITHIYNADRFIYFLKTDHFHEILHLLPNTTYNGLPFIIDAQVIEPITPRNSYTYKIITHNPKVMFKNTAS